MGHATSLHALSFVLVTRTEKKHKVKFTDLSPYDSRCTPCQEQAGPMYWAEKLVENFVGVAARNCGPNFRFSILSLGKYDMFRGKPRPHAISTCGKKTGAGDHPR